MVQEEKRICQEIQLQSYLNKLINNDMENRIANLKTDDTKDEDSIKKVAGEIEQECVSPFKCYRNMSILTINISIISGK